MKKLIALFCSLLMLFLCCTAFAIEIEVPSIMSTLVRHRVLLQDSSDTFDEYIVVFFNNDNEVLVQLNDETHFKKSAGYTMDYLKSIDISQYYPGFNEMSFADSIIEDKGTYYSFIVRFKDLTYLDNLSTLKKNGILPDDSYIFDANYLIEGLVKTGMKELDMLEYSGLGLDFTVE